MDPNNNQPINTNPLQQPVVPSVPPVVPAQSAPAETFPPQPQAESAPAAPPPKGHGKGTILLILVLILIIGISAYFLFAQNQLNNQKATNDSTTEVVLPSNTPTTTPEIESAEEIEVESPETDLKDVEADVQAL